MTEGADGAWGVRFPDFSDLSRLLSRSPASWPSVIVDSTVTSTRSNVMDWSNDRAHYTLLGGAVIEIEREPLRARLSLRRPTPREGILVPHLSSVASTVACWSGHGCFHAGAFAHEGRAWGVLGHKGAGKSSFLMALAKREVTVLSDDLTVIAHGMVAAGPRCIDLRADTAATLSTGRDIGVIGARQRFRAELPACEPEVQLAGWIELAWGKQRKLETVAAGDRISILTEHRALRLPWIDPFALLDYAGKPMLRWSRPKRLDELAEDLGPLVAGLSAVD